MLPSCTTGLIEATKIDYEKRLVYISDDSEIKGDVSHTVVPFDMLVVGVGAENATFGQFSLSPRRRVIANFLQEFPASANTPVS